MADNFFVSTLKFNLEDNVSNNLGKIENNFNSFFEKINKLANIKNLLIGGAVGGALHYTKEAIKDYSELEKHIVSLGIALDVSDANASSLLSNISLIKNAIPLEEVRQFTVGLANASEKGKELSQNNKFVETALKISQAKGIGLDRILEFSIALSKAYKNLAADDITSIISDLSTLSVKAVEGISAVTTSSLQELQHYGVDIKKLIPLLATMQEYTGSSSEGLNKILSIFGDLQGEKGALALASLGIEGDLNFSEQYRDALYKFPGAKPEEIANVLSKNWKMGLHKLLKKEGGDMFTSISILFENLNKLKRDFSPTYLIDLLGQPNIALLDILTSEDTQEFYKNAIEKTSKSEDILEEQYKRRQETLSATFADTGKLLSQLSEQFGEFTANLLKLQSVFSSFNNFLRGFLQSEDKSTYFDPTYWMRNLVRNENEDIPMLGEFLNPFSMFWSGKLSNGFTSIYDQIQSDLKKNINPLNLGFTRSSFIGFDVNPYKPIEKINEHTSNSDNNKSNSNAVPSGTFNYSPIFNITSGNENVKNDVSSLLGDDKLNFFKQSNRLMFGK